MIKTGLGELLGIDYPLIQRSEERRVGEEW